MLAFKRGARASPPRRPSEQALALEHEVVVGEPHRQLVGRGVDDVDARAAPARMPCAGAARPCVPRRPRRRPRRSWCAPPASSARAGSVTEATTTRWWAARAGSTGSRPSSIAEDSSEVSSTTRARWVPSRTTSVASADQSASTSRDSTGARVEIVSCSRRARSVPRDPGVDDPVAGEHLHPVAGVAGERGEEQRGIHRGIEAGGVADPAGAGARGVEHDDDAAVLLGLPGAHDEVLAPGGGPPVDRAHVVALDVVAQAVELGALAAGAHRGPAVELAQHGEPAGQVLAGGEGVQRADRAGHRDRPLPRGQPQRPEHAHGDPVGEAVTAPGGHEVGGEAHPLVRGHGEVVHGIHRAGRRAATRRGAGRARRDPRCW